MGWFAVLHKFQDMVQSSLKSIRFGEKSLINIRLNHSVGRSPRHAYVHVSCKLKCIPLKPNISHTPLKLF